MKKLIMLLTSIAMTSCATKYVDPRLQVVGDTGKSDDLIVNIITKKENNLYKVQATIQNDSSKTVQTYYRCVFFDRDNFQLEDNSQWVPILIYPHQFKNVPCASVNPEASSFKLEINSKGRANKVVL